MTATQATEEKIQPLDIVCGEEAKYDNTQQAQDYEQEPPHVVRYEENDISKFSSLFQQQSQFSDSNVALHQNENNMGNKSVSDMNKYKSLDINADTPQCVRSDSNCYDVPNKWSSFDGNSTAVSHGNNDIALNQNRMHSNWNERTPTHTHVIDDHQIYVNANLGTNAIFDNEKIHDTHNNKNASHQEIINSSGIATNNYSRPHVNSQDLKEQTIRSSEEIRFISAGSQKRIGHVENENKTAILQSHDDFAHHSSYNLPHPDRPFDYALHNASETSGKQSSSFEKNDVEKSQKRSIFSIRKHHVQKLSSSPGHEKNSILHPIIFSRKQSNASTAISDWDPEWTEQDSSYGAACPVCGCVPKSVRRAIEVTLISSFVVMTMLFIVSTSFRWHGNDTNNSLNLEDDYNMSFVDDYYIEANQAHDDYYVAVTYDDDKFNSYADDLADDYV